MHGDWNDISINMRYNPINFGVLNKLKKKYLLILISSAVILSLIYIEINLSHLSMTVCIEDGVAYQTIHNNSNFSAKIRNEPPTLEYLKNDIWNNYKFDDNSRGDVYYFGIPHHQSTTFLA